MVKNNYRSEKVSSLIRHIVITACAFLAFRFFIRGLGQGVYNTLMGKDYWQGVFFFGIAAAVAYGLNLKKAPVYISGVLYYALTAFVFFFLKKDLRMNSSELWDWYVRIWIGAGTAIPVFVDAVFHKRLRKPGIAKLGILILCSAPVVFSLLHRNSFEHGIVALSAMVWVYAFVRFEDKRLEEAAISIAAGGLLATTYALLKGFVEVPYHFEKHYIGNFNDSPIYAGIMCIGVVMCMALFAYCYPRLKKRQILLILFALLYSSVFVFAAVLANGRNAFLALIFTTVIFAYLLSSILKKKAIFHVTIWSIAAVGLITVALIVFLVATNGNKSLEWTKDIPQLEMMREVGLKTLRTESREGIIPDGSLWNCVDNFTSERLTIWICTIRQLKMFDGNSTSIHIRDDLYYSTHNTYLGFLNRYGIMIGACSIIAWFVSLFFFVKRIKDDKAKDGIRMQTILSALYMVYCSSIFLFETFYMVSYLLIVWLFIFALFFDSSGPRKKLKM